MDGGQGCGAKAGAAAAGGGAARSCHSWRTVKAGNPRTQDYQDLELSEPRTLRVRAVRAELVAGPASFLQGGVWRGRVLGRDGVVLPKESRVLAPCRGREGGRGRRKEREKERESEKTMKKSKMNTKMKTEEEEGERKRKGKYEKEKGRK